MAIKLKLLLQRLHLLLALRALVFGAFLWYVKTSGFSLLSLVLCVGAAGFLYARHLFQTIKFAPDFVLLLATALVFMHRLPDAYLWLGIAYFTISWLLFLGVKDVELIHRDEAYALFILSLLYADILLFFTSSLATFFVFRLIVFFAVSVFLFGQILKFRRPVTNTTLAFLLAQLMWALSLLPIGFLQATNASFIVALAMIDLTLLHFKNAFTPTLVLKKIMLYGVLLLLIFLTAQWTLAA